MVTAIYKAMYNMVLNEHSILSLWLYYISNTLS